MRYQALVLILAVGTANAATLEVAVSQGAHEPERFYYQLNGEVQTLDLRKASPYTVAVADPLRKKEICRDAEYRTGMVMNLRDVEKPGDGQYKIEVVGQVSDLKSLEEKSKLECGVNMVPIMQNNAFSDTSVLSVGKPKVIVVDGKTTLFLTVME